MADAVDPVLEEIECIASVVKPVHNLLNFCGVTAAVSDQIFIDVEGLDTIVAFANLNGDNDVTEMAKRMASQTAAVGRVILGTMQIKMFRLLCIG